MNPKTTELPARRPERSLDPDDWEALRKLGHKAIDDSIEYLRGIGDQPIWQAIPDDARALFEEPVPRKPTSGDDVYALVRQHVMPYPTGNIHPRFWSWVGGTGTPTQIIADVVISAMNSANLGFDEVSSTYVELQLLEWLKTLLGYPQESSGLLVSGGSMANLVGLAVARTHGAPYDVRQQGVNTDLHPRLMYYASTETHSSVRKGIELLGLGEDSLRLIPVKSDFTVDTDALTKAVQEDRDAGNTPACIVANIGTVNTGAVDDITAIADIAEREGMWLHADAAFGGFARLSEKYKHLAAGLERADSLAFDLHKWMYVQYDCGCVLVKSGQLHQETFSVTPSYLRQFTRGLASGPFNFSEYGVQLSRSFKALRPWMALRIEGADRYGDQIEQNIEQARYLTDLVEADQRLELLAPTAMNIVNFRFVVPGLSEAELEEMNAEILVQLHERGLAGPSSTVLNQKFSLRVAICNHRSRREDFTALVEGVIGIGEELIG